MKPKRSSSVFFLIIALLIQGQMQISFASGSTIEGVVTDAYTNEPIPLAEVDVGAGSIWFEHNLGSTTTDGSGRYMIQVPMSDEYQFIVHTQEIERDHYRFYDHCWSRRTLAYTPTIHADFVLEPAGSILVKMFDLNGKALGEESWRDSWVKDISLKSITREWLDNRTYGHTYQPYRNDDEEIILLSPEGVTTTIWSKIAVTSHGILNIEIDNEGVGFAMHRGDLLILNLNYEVTQAVYREFNATSGSLFGQAAALGEAAAKIAAKLAEAEEDHLRGNDAECATESNKALLEILSLRDEMWLKTPFVTGHPRLLFTRSDSAIREKIKNGFPLKAWESILADCDYFLKHPPPQLSASGTTRYVDWLLTAFEAVARMEYLSFAYLVTNEVKYAAKAKEIIWTVLAWHSWTDPTDQCIRCRPGLMGGEIAAGLAISYDWLFSYLTTGEQAYVRQVVGERGAEVIYEFVGKAQLQTNPSKLFVWKTINLTRVPPERSAQDPQKPTHCGKGNVRLTYLPVWIFKISCLSLGAFLTA